MQNRGTLRLGGALLGGALAILSAAAGDGVSLVRVQRLWDARPHCAFTDLCRHHGRWWCVFREGPAHVSPDGAIRVLTSSDGREWTSAARLTHGRADLRDPKVCRAPDGRLMLTAAGAWHQPAPHRHQTFAWFSADGRDWGRPVPIGEPDFWLWRVSWHAGEAAAVGYRTRGEPLLRVYHSRNGREFTPLIARWNVPADANETTLRALRDGRWLAVVRRDGRPGTALLGTASALEGPWTWRDLGAHLGGPNWIELPDGRLIAAGRIHEGGVHTALLWLDPERARLRECLRLPSGGDTSYPGLVWHAHRLWVSYYSSHEEHTAIYLAEVSVPPRSSAPAP